MTELEADGIGYPTPAGVVPIVPAAVIFDLAIGDPRARPGPAAGAAAYRAATSAPVEMGNVGAGTGATLAGWRGPQARRKGGVGSAATKVGEVTVGALAVVNAVGDAFTLEGVPLTGGDHLPIPVPPVRPRPDGEHHPGGAGHRRRPRPGGPHPGLRAGPRCPGRLPAAQPHPI